MGVNTYTHIKSANGLKAWIGRKEADGTTIKVITKENAIRLEGISTF